jgi:hypothetical protein
MRFICILMAMSMLTGCAEERARHIREAALERSGPCFDMPMGPRDYCPNVKHRLEGIPVSGDLLTAGRVVFVCRCVGAPDSGARE